MDSILKNKEKFILAGSFFIIVLGTVFCDFNKFFDSELKSKWYWLYITVSVCGLLFLLVRRREILNPEPFGYWFILLFVYCFLRVITGQFVLSFLLPCILYFLICYLFFQIFQEQTFGYISGSIVISAFFLACHGIAQYVGLLHEGTHFRVVGNFNNPAGFASMLAISVPFIFYFTLSGKRWMKYIAWFTYAVVGTAVVLSASRVGMIAIAVSSFFYILKQNKTFRESVVWKKVIFFLLISTVLSGLYFIKKDSADGRILIWRCTLDMIREKPLFGHGYKSFEAQYMLYQARYFEQNPESEFALLADNVKHPFNEFLFLITEFGLVSFLLLVFLVVILIRTYLQDQDEKSFILMLAMAAIFILSCFSYPFQYPFTWLITGFSIAALSCKNNERSHANRGFNFLILSSSIVLLVFTVKEVYYESQWYNIVKQSGLMRKQDVISEYECLYPFMNKNAYFVYNYAAILRYNDPEKSTEMVIVCEKMLNDFDVQMLKADNYKKQRDFYKAKDGYVLASQMCPNRFVPLYELTNIYDSIKQPDIALKIANEIINKPVKVPSATISAIKMKMKEKVENQASSVNL
ncbi:MAG: O-antigen ligase family protein [Bacteroidales bacterium]|jgi:O-antigen ligase|nr:O-antigen ligase family protein [Bacteroidales bacterium]